MIWKFENLIQKLVLKSHSQSPKLNAIWKLRVAGLFLPTKPTKFVPEPNAKASGSYPLNGVLRKRFVPVSVARIPRLNGVLIAILLGNV